MLLFVLLPLVIFLSSVSGQIDGPCINGKCVVQGDACYTDNQCYRSSGPCINGGCQGALVCVDNLCVDVSYGTTTTTTTVAPTAAPTAATCVDLAAPGKPSDCPQNANLCNDPTYYALMTQQCPKTCGRCPGGSGTGSVTTSTCVDLVGPSGVSDCPGLAYLCNNAAYYALMTQQCPKTCGRC